MHSRPVTAGELGAQTTQRAFLSQGCTEHPSVLTSRRLRNLVLQTDLEPSEHPLDLKGTVGQVGGY